MEQEETYLPEMFEKNRRPMNYVGRTAQEMNKERSRRERSNRRITHRCINSPSELTTTLLQSQGITVIPRPSQTFGRVISKPKERLNTEERTYVVDKAGVWIAASAKSVKPGEKSLLESTSTN